MSVDAPPRPRQRLDEQRRSWLSRLWSRLTRARRRANKMARKPRRPLVVIHRWLSIVLGLGVLAIAVSGFWKVMVPHLLPLVEDSPPVTPGDIGWQRAYDRGFDALVADNPDRDLTPLDMWRPDPTWSDRYWISAQDADGNYLWSLVDPGSGQVLTGSFDDEGVYEIDGVAQPHWFTSVSEFMSNAHYYLWLPEGPDHAFSTTGWCHVEVTYDETTGAEILTFDDQVGGTREWTCRHVVGPFLTGTNFTGTVAFGWLIVTAVGFYLWYFPGARRWRRIVRVRARKGLFTFNFDLHKVLGVLTLVGIVPFLVSGMLFSTTYAEKTQTVMRAVTPAPAETKVMSLEGTDVSSEAQGRSPIGMGAAVEAALADHPDAEVEYLTPPADETGTYAVYLVDEPTFQSYGNVVSYVDAYDGEVVGTASERHGNPFDITIESLVPYHVNEWGGLPQAGLMFFVTLVGPLALTVTGVAMFVHRHRKRRRVKRERAPRQLVEPGG